MSYTAGMGPPATEPIGLELARTAKVVSRAFDDALAEAVGVEGPTLTHHLNRMEAAGLITRTRDPANRRVHQVELTEAGEASFQRLLGSVAAFDQRLRRGVTEQELEAMSGILGRLRANVARDEGVG